MAKQVSLQSQLPPQPQFQLTPAATAAVSVPAINNNHLPHLDTLLSMPSTSAQAAALNAAAVAAGTVLDLASPSRKAAGKADSHSSIIKVISPATLAPNGSPSLNPISGQAKVIVGARPSAHIINLDDYQCPSEILQTSKQLAATTVITSTATAKVAQPTSVSRDSSSESDGVEFVGIYPAWKPTQNALPKPKAKTQKKSLGATGQINRNVGFNHKNMYIYNNNNSGNSLAGAMGNMYAESQIIKAMSDLKALEKTMKWTPTQSVFSPSSVKGGGGAMGSPGTGSSSRQ